MWGYISDFTMHYRIIEIRYTIAILLLLLDKLYNILGMSKRKTAKVQVADELKASSEDQVISNFILNLLHELI